MMLNPDLPRGRPMFEAMLIKYVRELVRSVPRRSRHHV